jgi:hypothetical protein
MDFMVFKTLVRWRGKFIDAILALIRKYISIEWREGTNTNRSITVSSGPLVRSQRAGEESTTTVSEYIFGITRRSDAESQANTTGGKHLDLHSSKIARDRDR